MYRNVLSHSSLEALGCITVLQAFIQREDFVVSSDLLDDLVSKPQRETAGSDTASRFGYQKNWAFCEMLRRHMAEWKAEVDETEAGAERGFKKVDSPKKKPT